MGNKFLYNSRAMNKKNFQDGGIRITLPETDEVPEYNKVQRFSDWGKMWRGGICYKGIITVIDQFFAFNPYTSLDIFRSKPYDDPNTNDHDCFTVDMNDIRKMEWKPFKLHRKALFITSRFGEEVIFVSKDQNVLEGLLNEYQKTNG